LERKIGSGAFGEIWEALDQQTGRKVAVKFENVDMKKQ
jgi:serine/threonine protein kinase